MKNDNCSNDESVSKKRDTLKVLGVGASIGAFASLLSEGSHAQTSVCEDLVEHEDQFDSMVDFIDSAPCVDLIYIRSFHADWQNSIDGPLGSHYRSKTGKQNTEKAGKIGGIGDESDSYTGIRSESGLCWDRNGIEWSIVGTEHFVEAFGAYGDNQKDDSNFIMDALLHGGKKHLRAAIYKVSEPITFPRGTFLYGQGMSQTAIVQTDSAKEVIVIDQSQSYNAAVTDTGISQMRLSGGLSGIRVGEDNTNNWGVKFTADRVWMYNNVVNCRLHNGWELYFFKCLFDQAGGKDLGYYENLIIYGTLGPAFQNTTKFEQCDFTNVDADQNVLLAISNLHNTAFVNCVFQRGRSPNTVALRASASFLTNLKLDGCYFEDYKNFYIQLPATTQNSGIHIVGCDFQDHSERTQPMISNLYGAVLEANAFVCSSGSVAIESITNCTLIGNRRTTNGTNNLDVVDRSNVTTSTLIPRGGTAQINRLVGGEIGYTHGTLSVTKTIDASTLTDFFLVKLENNYGHAILDLNVVGRNSIGGEVTFCGKRLIKMNAGSAVSVVTIGTDYSSNTSAIITWSTTNTFKVQFGNTTGSTVGVAASMQITGGGGNGNIGSMEYITVV